jgi:hypothetical protein
MLCRLRACPTPVLVALYLIDALHFGILLAVTVTGGCNHR